MVLTAFCNGFSKCELSQIKTCETGSVYNARFNDKYKPGAACHLVERYSGSKMGIAVVNENAGQSSLCLNLSKQVDIFHGTYNGLATSFVFNVVYRMYNVKKEVTTGGIQYRVLDNASELYVGPNNLLAIKMEWKRVDGVILNGWMTYSSETTPSTQLWDGTVGATQLTNSEIITNENLLWYAYYQNDRKRATGIYSGSFLGFQSYGRVFAMDLVSNPLDPYVGGILQKDNNGSFSEGSRKSCLDIGDKNTIAFLLSGQNNFIQESSNSFGRGHIDFCSETDCGNCSLATFQVTTPNGCIEGTSGLNTAQIIAIIFGVIGFFVICIVICQYFVRRNV